MEKDTIKVAGMAGSSEKNQNVDQDIADLAMAMGSQLDVAMIPNNPDCLHPNYDESHGRKRRRGEQNERRQELLQAQKRRRVEKKVDDEWEPLAKDYCQEGDGKWAPPSKGHHPHAKKTDYKVLMLSEWMVDVPDDLATHWLLKPCPAGRHVLVVASRGCTEAFSKGGHSLARFSSLLPGGSQELAGRYTVLDCIWSRQNSTYYVLDVLSWNCQSFLYCDTDFRFFWLSNQMKENPELQEISKNNKERFQLVPSFSCTHQSLTDVMSQFPFYKDGPPLDGCLFYHKEGDYYKGITTPLVTWLKPFMLHDILDIPISEGYEKERPPGYENQQSYIDAFDQKKGERQHYYRTKRTSKQNNDSSQFSSKKSIDSKMECGAEN